MTRHDEAGRPPRPCSPRSLALRLAAALSGLLVAGCISVGGADPAPRLWYELAPALPTVTRATPDPRRLRVDVLTGSAFYDAVSIVYSRAPSQRAYYQFASWTEPVAQRLGRVVVDDLRVRGLFTEVEGVGARARADLHLQLVVADFYHDAEREPGVVRVRFSAELRDRRRALLGQREFRLDAPVEQAEAAAAVRGFDSAVAQGLGELAQWLAQVAGRP